MEVEELPGVQLIWVRRLTHTFRVKGVSVRQQIATAYLRILQSYGWNNENLPLDFFSRFKFCLFDFNHIKVCVNLIVVYVIFIYILKAVNSIKMNIFLLKKFQNNLRYCFIITWKQHNLKILFNLDQPLNRFKSKLNLVFGL